MVFHVCLSNFQTECREVGVGKVIFSIISLFFNVVIYAQGFSLPLPLTDPAVNCEKIGNPTIKDSVQLYKSFDGDVKNFRLYDGRWSPHYDGGYDERLQKWLGYDWVVKRTLAGSHEQQIYVDPLYKGNAKQSLGINPFSIVNNNLVIEAKAIPPNLNAALPGFAYTSGLLTTRTSFLQLYGYFEIDAKVPQGIHLLPAFWLLPFDKSWPPEIDIFEAPGHLKNTIATTVHSKDVTGKLVHSGCKLIVVDYDKSFHKYGALWLPDRIIFYIDRVPVSAIKSPSGFDKPMYLLINLAVGGDWVGFMSNNYGIPAEFIIKDVAAYSLKKNYECISSQGGAKLCQGM